MHTLGKLKDRIQKKKKNLIQPNGKLKKKNVTYVRQTNGTVFLIYYILIQDNASICRRAKTDRLS